MIAPYVSEKKKDSKILTLKFDVEASQELTEAYQIAAMPTFLVLSKKWNNVVKRISGGGKNNVNAIYEEAAKYLKK